jgi:rod shape-determining protein MreD
MTENGQQGGGAILATLALAMFLTLLPMPTLLQDFRPPWVALVLIYWCLALPLRVGVGWAWLVGLLLDVLSGTVLGQHALAFSVMAFAVVQLHQRIRIFPLVQQAFSVLVMLLVERLLSLWVMGGTGQPAPRLGYWAPAVVGAILWPWVYIVLRDVRRRFQVA